MNQARTSRYEGFQNRVEDQFKLWGSLSYRYAWLILIAVIGFVGYISTEIHNISVDTSTESYLHKDDPVRAIYDDFRNDFGRDEKVLLLLESDGDIVNEAFLRRLEKLHRSLETVDQVEKVDSLLNARLTIGKDDELIVKDLLEDWPQSEADFSALRETIRNNPMYQKLLVNDDLSKTIVVVTPDTFSAAWTAEQDDSSLDEFDFEDGFGDELSAGFESDQPSEEAAEPPPQEKPEYLTGEEMSRIVMTIEKLIEDQEQPDFQIGLTGSPVFVHNLNYILGRDMFVFSAIGIGVISLLLTVIFRRLIMVVLPITVAVLSLYFTIAFLTFLGVGLNSSIQILPSLLLAVGVGNSVHIFNSFWQGIDEGLDKEGALAYALGHSGVAVVMTGLTTAGGLMSFITAGVQTVADMGIVAPLGIIFALFFSLVLLPALIAIFPFKHKGQIDDSDTLTQHFLSWCAKVSTENPKAMVAAWMAGIVVGFGLITQITISHFPLGWFPEGTEFRDATETMDRQFKGAAFTEVIFDTGKENGLHDPAFLHAVDEAVRFAEQLNVNGVQMGAASSMLDINKDLHQALNGNDPAYYVIPDDRALIAQELLLFENSGSDDLEDIVDTPFSKMRLTLKNPNIDAIKYPAYLDQLESGVREIIGDKAEVTFTGIITMLGRIVGLLISSTINAYLLAFLIIAPLMMLLVGSVRTGLIAMIPNLAPIILTLALMPILGIPLDAFTLLVGSIALGLAVDDTIHFMHNYQRFYLKFGDAPKAVRETLRTTGRALLFTSVVLTSAFLVNLAGSMSNVQNFGILTGFCITVAFLSDVLLAPALVTLLARAKEKALKEKLA